MCSSFLHMGDCGCVWGVQSKWLGVCAERGRTSLMDRKKKQENQKEKHLKNTSKQSSTAHARMHLV